MTVDPHNKPCVAHYASSYLPLTENWIYRILINHNVFWPIFLTRKKVNLKLFPLIHLYSLDDFSAIKSLTELFLFKLLGFFPFMKSACEKNQAELLHVHFGYHGVKMLGLQSKIGIPMVCSFYGDDAFVSAHAKTYSMLFERADKILVLGPYMKSVLTALGCDEDKLLIHHLGIDVEQLRFIERRGANGQPIRFLVASSFVKKKGVELAIQALSKFRDRYDFSLDIIGDGPLKSEILGVIENSGMNDKVRLHGYQPYEYFINLAYECDVFIQASRTTEDNRKEGTPMAIVDTMATGMAVISTRHSDIPEIVIDDLTGYLADENNVESLQQCIQKIFDNPSRVTDLGKKGRARVEQEFNCKTQTLKLEALYSELIESS